MDENAELYTIEVEWEVSDGVVTGRFICNPGEAGIQIISEVLLPPILGEHRDKMAVEQGKQSAWLELRTILQEWADIADKQISKQYQQNEE